MTSTRLQPSVSAIPVLQHPPQSGNGLSFRKANMETLQREAVIIWFLLKHPQAPWYTRGIAGCVLVYVLSPVQLIPSFIPVIGLSDDLLVLSTGAWLIRMLTPARIVQDARDRAQASMKQGENIRSQAARTATFAAVIIIWLIVTAWFSVAVLRK
jgi:uncharacterized membrane protein YkvA (DUF1232 family)